VRGADPDRCFAHCADRGAASAARSRATTAGRTVIDTRFSELKLGA
jgi:hypothetical protein